MPPTLEFRLLGSVEALRDGRPVVLGGLRRRALLAMLALDAGRVVSTARLIDGIWGDDPPETVHTALHGHVSALRRELGKEAILTRAPGYALVAGAVDVPRAEEALEAARRMLAAGDAAGAARALDDVLALWRGPPLADVTEAPFAAAARPALVELEVELHEEASEARLASGDAEGAIPGLRRLVAEHPLRERPRVLLMQSLARADRQAEALDVYADGRRVLAEELGADPGERLRELHAAILRGDPEVVGVAGRRTGHAPPARPAARRRRWVVLAGAGVLAVAGAAIAFGGGSDPVRGEAVRVGNALVRLDARHDGVAQQIPLAGTPGSVAAAGSRAWVVDADAQTIMEVARGRRSRVFATGSSPVDIAAGASGMWVAQGANGEVVTSLGHVVPGSGAVSGTVELPAAGSVTSNAEHDRVAVSARAVWVLGSDGTLVRADPLSGEVVRVLHLDGEAIAASQDGVWVLDADRTLVHVAERDTRPGVPIDVPGSSAGSLAVGGGSVWVTDPGEGTLTRVDARATGESRELRLAGGASAVAYANGAVWVLVPGRDGVARVDPEALRVTDELQLGGTPRDIAASGGNLWISVAAARAARAESCRPLAGDAGEADAVVVADLPLRAGPGTPVPAMARAIATAVERHSGDVSVAAVICDDSTAAQPFGDKAKCRANARTYAEDDAIVAVIGPYISDCAHEQVRIAAHAAGGPLAIVSPTSTDPVLARALRRRDRGALFRIPAPDDRQAAAAAQYLYDRGHRSVFLLDEYQGYGFNTASAFQVAARAVGLRVIGRRSWRASTDRAALAARVARAGPDVVWVGGSLYGGAGMIVRALGAHPGLAIAGPEGLLPVSGLFHDAGAAARGALIVTGTPPRGRAVPAADAATRATETVLDAIARSGGSRGGVARALRASGRFDAFGDPVAPAVAMLRARRGGGSKMQSSTDGADVVAVIRPPRP